VTAPAVLAWLLGALILLACLGITGILRCTLAWLWSFTMAWLWSFTIAVMIAVGCLIGLIDLALEMLRTRSFGVDLEVEERRRG